MKHFATTSVGTVVEKELLVVSNRNPYEEAIAALEAKRAEINKALDLIRRLAEQVSTPTQIASDAFFTMTVSDATKKYLGMVNKRPQTTQQVADALKRGGMPTNASNFPATVLAILRRVTKDGTDSIVRVGGCWGLADWYYPERRLYPRKKSGKKIAGKGK